MRPEPSGPKFPLKVPSQHYCLGFSPNTELGGYIQMETIASQLQELLSVWQLLNAAGLGVS